VSKYKGNRSQQTIRMQSRKEQKCKAKHKKARKLGSLGMVSHSLLVMMRRMMMKEALETIPDRYWDELLMMHDVIDLLVLMFS